MCIDPKILEENVPYVVLQIIKVIHPSKSFVEGKNASSFVVSSSRSFNVIERVQIHALRLEELRDLIFIAHLILRPRLHHEHVIRPHVGGLL